MTDWFQEVLSELCQIDVECEEEGLSLISGRVKDCASSFLHNMYLMGLTPDVAVYPTDDCEIAIQCGGNNISMLILLGEKETFFNAYSPDGRCEKARARYQECFFAPNDKMLDILQQMI